MPLPHRTPAEQSELAEMDDIAFLAHCRAVRETRESTPGDQVTAELAEDLERVNREFLRRAGMAWRAGYP